MIDHIHSQHQVTTASVNGITRDNQANGEMNQSSKDVEEKSEVNKSQVQEIVKALNNFLHPSYTSLKFTMHEKLGEYYVQVIDEDTKEVVREVPPKKMLDLYAAMAEKMGLIIDEKR